MRIVIHIGTLRLTGMAPDSSRSIATGLRQELARVLAATGIAAEHSPVARLRPPPVRVVHDATPGQVGAAVARGIAGRLAR